jgi:hypothetical protein
MNLKTTNELWRIFADGYRGHEIQEREPRRAIAYVYSGAEDALLIAAAPSLRYALQAFVDYYEQAGMSDDDVPDDDDPNFDGDEKFNVRQARTVLAQIAQGITL